MQGAAIVGATLLALSAIAATTTLRRIHVRQAPVAEAEEAVA